MECNFWINRSKINGEYTLHFENASFIIPNEVFDAIANNPKLCLFINDLITHFITKSITNGTH